MPWEELTSKLERLAYGWPLSDILLFHLGGDDIGHQKKLQLHFSYLVYSTIQKFKALSPSTNIVFSEIIPCLVWLNSDLFKAFEKLGNALIEC